MYKRIYNVLKIHILCLYRQIAMESWSYYEFILYKNRIRESLYSGKCHYHFSYYYHIYIGYKGITFLLRLESKQIVCSPLVMVKIELLIQRVQYLHKMLVQFIILIAKHFQSLYNIKCMNISNKNILVFTSTCILLSTSIHGSSLNDFTGCITKDLNVINYI